MYKQEINEPLQVSGIADDLDHKAIKADLGKFTIENYVAGPKWKIVIWYLINGFIFNSDFPWPYSLKHFLLTLFGAKVGKGLIIKCNVRIKYPWKLTIGENCWIGESVWIDNLADVTIGSNVCLSQGAMLLTGNHDYSQSNFPYRLGSIIIEDGVWIGAKSVVCPGVVCKTHAVLTVNSVANKTMMAWGIYAGNPASFVRARQILR